MKSRRIIAAMLICLAFELATSAQYRVALPGYPYSFPRDHFSHPEFQTEWWYYTGNVKSPDGHRFGFELTFFRRGVDSDAKSTGVWDIHDLYVAHLALSDLNGGKFLHAERTNRAGPGIAGASEQEGRIWNGNWQVTWRDDEPLLQAIDERFSIHLTLRSAKPPVIHGQNGISPKADGPGRASHYISLTRLNTQGKIELDGHTFQVTGAAWMDHEFFTHQLETDQVGWDWLSIQLDDNSELMLFNIRRKDGSIDPYSAGTFVDARGNSTRLTKNAFAMHPANSTWSSPATHAAYPLQWKILIPSLKIELECSTSLPSQELASSTEFVPAYWEGSVILAGSKGGSPIAGVGYLEMTGYDHPVDALR
ncbi:MAG TPA: lipocalin-like domain-containing protein [Candidatus Acidoferrum sp.]|nr:lipocalin-like domain-containing protein [Candidatus Acidoferrum sp.]